MAAASPHPMPTITIQPIADAIASLDATSPVRAALTSAEWAEVPLQLRQTAFFSARVESARLLSAMRRGLLDRLAMVREQAANGAALVTRDSWIASMRSLAERLGVQTAGAGAAGTLQDIRSNARLGLIFDIQTQRAAEFARWKSDQDPDILDAYPAQELVRIEGRNVPRDWREIWASAGGDFPAGRMAALKSSPIWSAISAFGTPYPPFDFNSGMGLEEIDRAEAEQLGLIQPGETPVPAEAGFADSLEASARGLDPDVLAKLQADFGDQVELADGRIRWRGQA